MDFAGSGTCAISEQKPKKRVEHEGPQVDTIRLLPAPVEGSRRGPHMINVAAIRMQQFGVQFYQASLTAEDIDKLVRFEVLNYGESGAASRSRRQRKRRLRR